MATENQKNTRTEKGIPKSIYSDPSDLLDPFDLLGKLWALPNTTVGLVYGLIGLPFGAEMSIGNNAIQFNNHPLMGGALTFGNVIVYGGGVYNSPDSIRSNGYPLGMAEMQHTFQSQVLGGLYFILHGISLGLAQIVDGNHHGPTNLLEVGPHNGEPSVWWWQ